MRQTMWRTRESAASGAADEGRRLAPTWSGLTRAQRMCQPARSAKPADQQCRFAVCLRQRPTDAEPERPSALQRRRREPLEDFAPVNTAPTERLVTFVTGLHVEICHWAEAGTKYPLKLWLLIADAGWRSNRPKQKSVRLWMGTCCRSSSSSSHFEGHAGCTRELPWPCTLRRQGVLRQHT